jgi:GntR family transcriptional regulator
MRDLVRGERGFEPPAGPCLPARTPRYEAIFCALRDRIRDGDYPVGDKLPPELELCREFQASRHTVREAIRRLTERGLVARRAGAGTTVLRRSGTGSYTQRISALPDLLAYAKNARLEVLDGRDVKVCAAEARLLKCRRGQWWHRLIALKHLAGTRRPVAFVLAYTHRNHPALRGVLDRRGVPLHDFIEARIGQRIAAVEQYFAAKPIVGREAEALGLAPGIAGFVIARSYLAADGTAVLVTSTVFPYDRMNYSMTLRLA